MTKALKEIFANIAGNIEGLVVEDLLLIIAGGILGAFLVYSIFAFIVAKAKRKNPCSCGVIHFNRVGNLFWSIGAWAYAVFAVLVHIGAGILMLSAFTFTWLAIYLLAFYIIMWLFMYLNYNRDKCCRPADAPVAPIIATRVAEQTTREPLVEPATTRVVEQVSVVNEPAPSQEPKASESESSAGGYTPLQPPVSPLETASEREMKEAELVAQAKAKMAGEVKRPRSTGARTTGARTGATRARATARPAAKESARVAVRVVPQKSMAELAQEKKNERIEELAQKIERQRLRAREAADTVTVTEYPYAQQTRSGFQTVGEAADKMDALQRRMDALRKTVNTREVVTTETTQKADIFTQKVSISPQNTPNSPHEITKSVTDLRNEQQKLQRHYDTLENLTKTPNKNKFDENEVKNALASLKTAIAELQLQIDKQS